jgi:hypothetical protein
MKHILRKIFAGNPTVETAKAIIAAQRDALFCEWHVKDIDAEKATVDELHGALKDCAMYWRLAYPENDNERVEAIQAACRAELAKRDEAWLRKLL